MTWPFADDHHGDEDGLTNATGTVEMMRDE